MFVSCHVLRCLTEPLWKSYCSDSKFEGQRCFSTFKQGALMCVGCLYELSSDRSLCQTPCQWFSIRALQFGIKSVTTYLLIYYIYISYHASYISSISRRVLHKRWLHGLDGGTARSITESQRSSWQPILYETCNGEGGGVLARKHHSI